jgi:ABC-type nitrate/sulfonate/bicarbonate transport system permease component
VTRRRFKGWALEFWLPVLLVLAWWYFSERSSSPFFPPLSKILSVLRDQWIWEHTRTDLLPSLTRLVFGLAIAIVLGVGTGLALGLWQTARRASMPTVDFLRAVPITTLVSAFIILLGFENSMKIAFIAYAAFFPILLNAIDGVRGVEPAQLDMAKAYGIGRWRTVFRIVLPAASPQIFAGLRVALAVAVLAMAFGEMVGGVNGLGYYIIFAQNTFRIPEMWSGIIVLGVIGYLVNVVFLAVERRALAWHRGWRASLLETG